MSFPSPQRPNRLQSKSHEERRTEESPALLEGKEPKLVTYESSEEKDAATSSEDDISSGSTVSDDSTSEIPADAIIEISDPKNLAIILRNGDYSRSPAHDNLLGSESEYKILKAIFSILLDWKVVEFHDFDFGDIIHIISQIKRTVVEFVGEGCSVVFYYQGHGHTYFNHYTSNGRPGTIITDYITTADGYSVDINVFLGLGCFLDRDLVSIFNKCRTIHAPRIPSVSPFRPFKIFEPKLALYFCGVGEECLLHVSNGSRFSRKLKKEVEKLTPSEKTDCWAFIVENEAIKRKNMKEGNLKFPIWMTR